MRTQYAVRLVAAALSLAPAAARAADAVPADMREKLETCAACHGADGVSPNQEVPSLAAQPDIFTQWQLVYMRDGTRKVEAMEEVVKGMTDSDIRFYGPYFASLPAPVPEHPKASNAESAEVRNLIKPRRCASCHDDTMAGKGEIPRLAGQRADYLIKAFRDYRSNVRRGPRPSHYGRDGFDSERERYQDSCGIFVASAVIVRSLRACAPKRRGGQR
jgi:cytochrome c553